jgi:hypothetical protein
MKGKLLFMVAAVLMMIAANTMVAQDCPPKSIYFLRGYQGGAGDNVVIDHLKAMEWTVFDTIPVKDGDGNFINYVDAAGYDLVVVSSTIASSDALQFRTLPVPLLTWESFALTGLGMTKANISQQERYYTNVPYNGVAIGDTVNSFEYLNIVDDPLAADEGLTSRMTGEILALTDRVPISGGGNVGVASIPNKATAIKILSYLQEDIYAIDNTGFITNAGPFIDSTFYAAYVYEEGAAMAADTVIAPARRGFYFFHDMTARVASDDAWKFFDNMIKWLTGCDLTIGIEDVERSTNNLLVYPSPVTQFATVVLDNPAVNSYEVEVYDLTGRRFVSTLSQKDRTTVDMRNMPSGLYMIRVSADNNQTYTTKVIKR